MFLTSVIITTALLAGAKVYGEKQKKRLVVRLSQHEKPRSSFMVLPSPIKKIQEKTTSLWGIDLRSLTKQACVA